MALLGALSRVALLLALRAVLLMHSSSGVLANLVHLVRYALGWLSRQDSLNIQFDGLAQRMVLCRAYGTLLMDPVKHLSHNAAK